MYYYCNGLHVHVRDMCTEKLSQEYYVSILWHQQL